MTTTYGVIGVLVLGFLLYLKFKLSQRQLAELKSKDQELQTKQRDVVADIDKLTQEMGYKVKEQQNASVTQIEDYYNDKKKS
jgi:vacuolar-type H+-ATPase subunit D/Vma8